MMMRALAILALILGSLVFTIGCSSEEKPVEPTANNESGAESPGGADAVEATE